MKHKIRYGMIGGCDETSFGKRHRNAAHLSDDFELVCGAFSTSIEKSRTLNTTLGLASNRIYENYKDLIDQESMLPEDQRMQVLTIVTPNDTHFAIASYALVHGFHVILEKPITLNVQEAEMLHDLVKQTKLFCSVNYTYASLPMILKARDYIKQGQLGEIKKVCVEYFQGWLCHVEPNNQKAKWRMDPKRSGQAGTLADVGSHAFHLMEFVTGLSAEKIFAQMNTLGQDRLLDDDSSVLIQFRNGASGTLLVSQVAFGAGNELSLRVFGTKGSLTWHFERCDELEITNNNGKILLEADSEPGAHLSALGALTNHYREFAKALNDSHDPSCLPTIDDGLRGMYFIEQAIASHNQAQWVGMPKNPLIDSKASVERSGLDKFSLLAPKPKTSPSETVSTAKPVKNF